MRVCHHTAASQAPMSLTIRGSYVFLRRVKFFRPFHSLLTSRISRQLQDFHLIALLDKQMTHLFISYIPFNYSIIANWNTLLYLAEI